MLLLSFAQLVWVAVLLLIASILIAPKAQAVDAKSASIRRALSRIVRIAGLSAAVAALIVGLSGTGSETRLDAENIDALNEIIHAYKEKLEYSWVVAVLLLVALILAVRAGRLDMNSPGAQKARWIFKSVASAKLLVGILAACSFVASGLMGRIQERAAKAENAEASLYELQLAVFQRMSAVAQQETPQSLLHAAEQADPQLATLHSAYNQVAPYLPGADDLRKSAPPAQGRPSVALPDISADHANALLESYAKGPVAEERQDALAYDLVGLIFDDTATDSIKKHLLGIENPLLSELVNAFIDPKLTEPIKRAISEKVLSVMNQRGNRTDLRNSLDPVVASDSGIIAAQLAGERPMGVGSRLGDPTWDAVREYLRLAVLHGLALKDPKAVASAREVINRFAVVWEASGTLFVSPSSRRDLAEKVFAAYLLRTPDYSALWGYGVISFTPQEYQETLSNITRIALLRNPKSKSLFRSVRERRSRPLVSANPPKPDALVDAIVDRLQVVPFSLWTDNKIAETFVAVHRSYPIDGYRLYFYSTKAAPLSAAARYFKSPDVLRAVGEYCPNSRKNSGSRELED